MKLSIEKGTGEREITINSKELLLLLAEAIKRKEINLTETSLSATGISVDLEKGIIILLDEYEKKDSKLTKIQGILTNQVRNKKGLGITKYIAFFRKDRKCQEHTIEECQRTKCQNCEIPVVF